MEDQPSRITTGSVPKYRQLLIILRNQILAGQIAPGERIPSEEDIIGIYGLSRGTVRKAISQLEAEKLIETEHGVGSFVRALHPNAIPFRFLGGREAGQSPREALPDLGYEVLAQERIPAPADIAERLRLPPGAIVIHIARRKKAGGKTVSFSERYIHEDILPSLVREDLSSVGSIHDLLVSASDYPLLRAEFEVEAHLLNESEASLLEGNPGEPAIVVHRMTFTAPNRPAVWYFGLFKNRYDLGIGIL